MSDGATIARALVLATFFKDEWHIDHQGKLKDVVGTVWECHDDCRCQQPQIVARFYNAKDDRWIVPRLLWEGDYYTDGDTGADEELSAKRAELGVSEPGMAGLILWDVE